MKKICLSLIIIFINTTLTYAQENNADKVFKTASNSIYVVKNVDAKTQRSLWGSGVAVDKNFLATNCHLVFAGNNFSVLINNKPKYAWVFYSKGDLCLVKVAGTQFTPTKLRPTKTVQAGEEAYVISNPDGNKKTITNGIISNIFQEHDGTFLQTNASVAPEASGAGLFDKEGNLIGIIFLKYEGIGTQTVNVAIPTELITNRTDDSAKEKSS